MSKDRDAEGTPEGGEVVDPREQDDSPPIFGSWNRFYIAVLVNTFTLYLLLYLFSRYTR